MKKIAALVALAGIASAASAVNQIDVKGRLAGDSTWLDTINFVSLDGSPANVEIAVFYNWEGGVAMGTCVNTLVTSGWNTAAGDMVTLLDRADSAQHPDGRQGNFNFGGQKQQAYTTGADAGTLRIAAANNTQNNPAGGISVKQNTPVALGAGLDTSNPILGFRFDIKIACDDTDPLTVRTLIARAPKALTNSFAVYNSLAGTGTNNNLASLLESDPLTINANWIVPAPASMALLGLGGLIVGRRRR